jgi:hypothetical protein
MTQLNLIFIDLPLPESCLWEQFEAEQKRLSSRPWRAFCSRPPSEQNRSRAMTDLSKIKPSHIQRAAMVYLRQSTPSQVEHNRESTARQYALADKACQLGCHRAKR